MTELTWGPYRNKQEVAQCFGAFSDAVFGHRLGLIWSAEDDAIWLRPPFYNGDDIGLALLVRYDGLNQPSSSSGPSWVDGLDKFLGGALTTLGQQEIDQAKIQLEAGRAMNSFIYDNAIKPFNDFVSRYEYVKDGISVVLDVAGIIAGGIAAAALLVGGGTFVVTAGLALGVLAGLASIALAVEDARHGWFLLQGDTAAAANLSKTTEYRWIEAVGPLLAIPDLLVSGRAALREVTNLSAVAPKIAARAQATGSQSAQASRDLRELMADADQSPAILRAAADKAAAKAAAYRRMQALTKAANLKLLAAREAKAAYGGTLYAGGMYAYDPPDLAKQAAGRVFGAPRSILDGYTPPPVPAGGHPPASVFQPGRFTDPTLASLMTQPAPRSGGQSAPSSSADNPWALLEPPNSKSCTNVPLGNLQLTTVAATRPRPGRK